MKETMKRTVLVGMAALLFMSIIVAGAFAFSGFERKGNPDALRMQDCSGAMSAARSDATHPLLHTNAVLAAINNSDYQAYLLALDESWTAYKAEWTQEKFDALVTKREQREENRLAMETHKKKVQQALAENNYSAWKEAMTERARGTALTDAITEDNFATFVAMHDAMQTGDVEKAQQLAEELGIGDSFQGMSFQGMHVR